MPTRVIPPRDKNAKNSTWHYYQEGREAPLEAQSHDALIDAIVSWRVEQDLPVGDPEADLEAYLREKFPSFERNRLRNSHPPAVSTYASDQRNLMDRVRMNTKLVKSDKAKAVKERAPWKLASKETSAERASICLACPSHAPIAKITLCAPCVKAQDRNVTELSDGRSIGSELGACTDLALDCRLAVHLPDASLARSRAKVSKTTPQECWLRPAKSA